MSLINSNVIFSLVLGVVTLLRHVDDVTCHGRLWEPPSRSSMWRRGYNTSVNINDNELSCGGFTNQWIAYGGLCGVCGDPYQQNPRDNENGGKYASGIITRTYPIGRNIDVVVGLTANHEGYFEFRLCPVNEPSVVESQACMERHPLRIVNGGDHGSRYYIKDPKLEGDIHIQLELPPNFQCAHCVLRWRYRTGTRWGCDPDQTCGNGKGPQEEFYGCSDIAVADVTSVIYNDPVQDPRYETTGLNDLGSVSTKTRGVFKTTHAPVYDRNTYQTSHHWEASGYTGNTKVNEPTIHQFVTPSTVTFAHFRRFLENITLNALIRYYGQNRDHTPGPCSPTKRYERNPIVHEYCSVCSQKSTECLTTMCTCQSRDIVTRTQSPIGNNRINRPPIDTQHLRSFVKRLIFKNKLMYANEPLSASKEVNQLPVYTKPAIRTTVTSVYGNIKKKEEIVKDVQEKIKVKSDRILPKKMNCKASDDYSHNPYMTNWCNTNCPFGFCPQRVCTCS